MDAYRNGIITFNEQLSPHGLTRQNFDRIARGADGVVVSGMGGSGLSGEIIANLRTEIRITVPIIIWKDYGLPPFPGNVKRPLYIFVSFSGNTEEPISGIRQLLSTRGGSASSGKTQDSRLKTRIAVVATGDALAALARQHNLPLVTFPAGDLTPRQSVGRLFYGLTELLHAARLIPRPPEYRRLDVRPLEGRGKRLARLLKGKTILIYTSNKFRHVGYIWKVRLNETAKTFAFNNVLPEINHNEAVAFDSPSHILKQFAVLFFHENGLSSRMRKRFRATERLIKRRGGIAVTLPLAGRTGLEKTWRSLVLADWTSYALGKMKKIPNREFNISSPLIVTEFKHIIQGL